MAPPQLTKADLRTIYATLGRVLPPANLPRTPEEQVEIGRVQALVAQLVDAWRADPCRGRKVLELRLPRAHAPRMNELAYLKPWMKNNLRKALDDKVTAALQAWPEGPLFGAEKQRWARVTRFSTKEVDEVSVDILGGKMPIDALVRAGVLADDRQDMLIREPVVMRTKQGNTHVLIEVFEVSDETEYLDPPKDEPVEQVVFRKTKIVGELPKKRSTKKK